MSAQIIVKVTPDASDPKKFTAEIENGSASSSATASGQVQEQGQVTGGPEVAPDLNAIIDQAIAGINTAVNTANSSGLITLNDDTDIKTGAAKTAFDMAKGPLEETLKKLNIDQENKNKINKLLDSNTIGEIKKGLNDLKSSSTKPAEANEANENPENNGATVVTENNENNEAPQTTETDVVPGGKARRTKKNRKANRKSKKIGGKKRRQSRKN